MSTVVKYEEDSRVQVSTLAVANAAEVRESELHVEGGWEEVDCKSFPATLTGVLALTVQRAADELEGPVNLRVFVTDEEQNTTESAPVLLEPSSNAEAEHLAAKQLLVEPFETIVVAAGQLEVHVVGEQEVGGGDVELAKVTFHVRLADAP
jgi:hypothetical protein